MISAGVGVKSDQKKDQMWNILTTKVINLTSSIQKPKLTTELLADSNEELGGSEILQWKVNMHTHWAKFTCV